MDKYKNIVKIEQIKELLRAGKNEEALDIATTVDVNRIKENFHFIILAKVFLANGLLSKAKVCYQKAYAKTPIRTIAMELTNLTIRLKSVVEAERYLDEFKLLAPNDYMRHVFKYKIDRIKGKPIADLIESLEKLKKEEFFDNWGFELAKLYNKAGEKEKCITTCNDVIIWFGEGEYVDRAMLLRAAVTGDKSGIVGNEKELIEKYGADGTASAKKLAKQAEEAKGNADGDNVADNAEAVNGKSGENGKSNGKNSEAGKSNGNGKNGEAGKSNGNGKNGEAGKSNGNGKNGEAGKSNGNVKNGEAGKLNGNVKNGENGKSNGNVGNGEAENTGNKGKIGDKLKKAKGQLFSKDDRGQGENQADSNKSGVDAKNVTEQVNAVTGEVTVDTEEIKAEDINRTSSEDSEKSYGLSKNRKKNNRKKERLRKKYGSSVNDISAETVPAEAKDTLKETGTAESNKGADEVKTESVAAQKNAFEKALEKAGAGNTGSKSLNENAEKPVDEDEQLIYRLLEEETKQLSGEQPAEEKRAEVQAADKKHSGEQPTEEKRAEAQAADKKLSGEQPAEEKRAEAQAADKKHSGEQPTEEKRTEAQAAEKKSRPDKAGIERIATVRENIEIHDGHAPKCIEMYPAGMLYGFLQKQEKTLEDYFGYFACNDGVNTQLVSVIDVMLCDKKYLSFCLECEKGAGRKKIVNGVSRLLGDAGQLTTGKPVWSDSEKVNVTDLEAKIPKLEGRCLVIDKAGSLEKKSVGVIVKMMKENSVSVVLIDNHKNIAKLLKEFSDLEEAMLNKIELLPMGMRELTEYIEYRADKAGLVYAQDAYDLLLKQMKSISKEHSEAAYSYAEKLLTQVIDNTDERNAKAYIEQTLSGGKLFRTDVITADDIPQ